jgi:hypothetical protein
VSLRCSIYGEHVSPKKTQGSLSHLSLCWVPETFQSGDQVLILDLFKHSLSTKDGLPPYVQARIIDLNSAQLKKYRRDPFLWVSVDSPGQWYPIELMRVVRYRIPTVVLRSNEDPADAWDFRIGNGYTTPNLFHPAAFEHPDVSPPFSHVDYGLSKESVVRVLRILARLKTAHTKEITSLPATAKPTCGDCSKNCNPRD